MTTPIPQPLAVPLLGNVFELFLDPECSSRGLATLAKRHGEIYRLNVLGNWYTIASSYALQAELSDDKRFRKRPQLFPPLRELKNLGSGLFTDELDNPEWGIAHRLLMPAFSATAVRGMFPDMIDVASQLLLKWERFGPGHAINPTADFTRLTFDTVALCSMSYRLNSFYTDTEPPFVKAMHDFLRECDVRSSRPSVVQRFMWSTNAKFEADKQLMITLADEIVAERKACPIEKRDLLALMLEGRDSRTGMSMSDRSITDNLLTFLIAGHETTSGLLSFAIYYLLTHPKTMERLQIEVDDVIGDDPLEVSHLSKLPYLAAVLRETLRVAPSAPARGVHPLEDTTLLGGKYAVEKDELIIVLMHNATHMDPIVWGDDASEFRPERMLDGNFENLPRNAWQPFGFGQRACIGRAFAWQEALIAMTLIVQRFELSLDDPAYTLQLKANLTIKPRDFHVRARVRPGRPDLCFVPLAKHSVPVASRSDAQAGFE